MGTDALQDTARLILALRECYDAAFNNPAVRGIILNTLHEIDSESALDARLIDLVRAFLRERG